MESVDLWFVRSIRLIYLSLPFGLLLIIMFSFSCFHPPHTHSRLLKYTLLQRTLLGPHVQVADFWSLIFRFAPTDGSDKFAAVHGFDDDGILFHALCLAREARELHALLGEHCAVFEFGVASRAQG